MTENREERRRHPFLTEEDLEMIAEKAADKAVIKMESLLYRQVGKTFIGQLTKIIGIIIVGLFLFLHEKGFIKL